MSKSFGHMILICTDLNRTYVPPRAAWGEEGRFSPLNPAAQPAELPSPTSHRRVNSSDNYYEDVDPRFAEQQPVTASLIPAALAPGGYSNGNPNSNLLQPVGLDGNQSYEDNQSGSRSPAESERSNFTSVSQRGVNPKWNPAQGGYGQPMPNRRAVNAPQQQRDMVLNSNPDFEIPGGGGRGGGGRGIRAPAQIPGMVPNSAYPGGTAL